MPFHIRRRRAAPPASPMSHVRGIGGKYGSDVCEGLSTVGAGVLDAKMGEGASTLPGVVAFLVGSFFRMPMVRCVGKGLVNPALYRLGRDSVAPRLGMTSTTTTTTTTTPPAV